MKSVMNHNFSEVPHVDIPRSTFDRSHGYKTTMDFDFLNPIYCDEYLPGDTANLSLNAFARLATPLHPIMDNMYIDTFWFSVPYRLVWDNWQRFNGEQASPTDSVDFLIPTMTSPSGGYGLHSLSDYFGIPTGIAGIEHSSLWHRAYQLIFNTWFKDENMQFTATVDMDDGPDDPADYSRYKRGKRHDYFTSCLPFAQKDFGSPVLLPLGTAAPVVGTGDNIPIWAAGALSASNMIAGAANQVGYTGTIPAGQPAFEWSNTKLEADLTNATAATINELRTAFQIQRMMERDARGGSRYIEIIKSHFGVTSPDARLQRPEYLGGGSTRIGITPVPQTSESTAGNELGTLAGYGTANISGSGFTKSFTEHCLIIGLACARADLTYQQGLPRKFSRQTRYDHYFPSLSHLGEQAVLQKEIFASGVPAEDDLVFGYNERYAEMRYFPSTITGQMRSQAAGSLDTWHLAQDFSVAPLLNNSFIQQNTPIDRAIAVPTEPHIIFDAYISLKHVRPIPTYAVPGMIDHF